MPSRTMPIVAKALLLTGLIALGVAHTALPASAQAPDKDNKERKGDTKERKTDGEKIPTDCLHLSNMYRDNLIGQTGKPISAAAAVQDSVVRHNTQQRLLWIAWALRCDLRPIIDTEIAYHRGAR